MNRIELLAPAGDLEKLKYAVHYGADAVYIGGQTFGLRAAAKNFSKEEMAEGIRFAHSHGRKVYVTANIIPHNEDLKALPALLDDIVDMGADAVIASDPGTIAFARKRHPDLKIHLSTQANTTNHRSAAFWHSQGIHRIVLARELSMDEIREIVELSPESLELEVFIHGAMCISYSGRCLLSNYLAGRDANRGACAHPCRWQYSLVESQRPGEFLPVLEDEKGTYFFNSKDLCMIADLKPLIETGIGSLKIEGRMKSLYYVANVVRVYRQALDTYYENPDAYVFNPVWLEELKKSSHRQFENGFYGGRPGRSAQIYDSAAYERTHDFIGIVKTYDSKTGLAEIEQRNKFIVGDEIEIMGPRFRSERQRVAELFNEKMEPVQSAPHPKQKLYLRMENPVHPYDILRMRKKEA